MKKVQSSAEKPALPSTIADYPEAKQARKPENVLPQLQRAVEQSPELVIITDRSGTIEYVNPAFETVTGYSREEATGQAFGKLNSEQHPGALYEEMWAAVLSGKVFRGIVTHRKKNGDSFVVEEIMTSLLDAKGGITHFVSTARDISERRKLELELQQAQKMDAIGRLAGGVAHDFNNLLMVISAYAELMLESLVLDHPLRRNVGEIMTASRRAADLTRQLLAFSRKQVQSLQVLDLNAVISEINSMLPRLIGEDIQLSFIPGADLGAVKADPVQIEQVVMNLAANARDAMPNGGQLTIETANVRVDENYSQQRPMVPPGDYVLLAITDSGEGIAPEHLEHIFEPFYTTKEAGAGTGLGLATVYGIVKQNGGYIWVYSEVGLGSTFKIYLPRVEWPAEKVETAQSLLTSPRGYETVLLVEDEAAVRRSTGEYLTRQGYNVIEAANGEDALRLSRQYCGPIHLLISDVVMPNMGAAKLAEELAAERPHMQVLFVSGYAEHTVLRQGKIDVTERFLQKPFSLAALAGKIREVLDKATLRARAVGSSA